MPKWDQERYAKRLWVLDLLDKGGVGVEVGVFRGQFSAHICARAKPRKLYLIDPWTLTGETFGWGKEYTSFGTLRTAVAREEAELRTALYPTVETVMIEGFFPQCANQITETLDWAYLDSSHQYDRTLTELAALEPMLKPDGIIAGDDWNTNPESPHYGVSQAVKEVVAQGQWELIKAGPGLQWANRRRS